MNAIRWTKAVTALVLLSGATACEDGLTEINANPNNPESVPVHSLLQSGIWQLVSNGPGRGVFGEWTSALSRLDLGSAHGPIRVQRRGQLHAP